MRTRRLATWTGLGLGLGLLGLLAAGRARAEDKPPGLVGYVKKLVPDRDGGDREVGVERAQIAMKGTGNWVGSDAHGQFRVQLLRSVRIGQSIEVEVEGVPGWLLYQPADGRVVVPEAPQTVTLKLLPKGSLRFLEREGIASLLTKMMSDAKDSVRTSPVPPGSAPPPLDLKGPMQKWASEYGLGLEKVQSAVDAWAKEVLSRRAQDDEQVCLAFYSQKQLERASQCFDALGQDDVQELERLKAQTLERTERAVRRFAQAADAYSLRYDFASALREYEKAERWAKRDVSPELWAEVQLGLGIVHQAHGCRLEEVSSLAHLAQAVTAYRAALEVYAKNNLQQRWATAQNNLGTALGAQASRTPGLKGTALRAQAVSAYRAALEVYSKRDLWQHWATTQNNLGTALSAQARQTDGPAGAELLAQAISAYRASLEVYTKKDLHHWATSQNNLGVALWEQARRTDGPTGDGLLRQAISAYRASLEVYTKQELPQHWAATQGNLGTALRDQAAWTPGPEGAVLLAQAASAYRSALEIRTKKELPQHWAMTQYNLGTALSDQARRTHGADAVTLWVQAVTAFHAAQEVLLQKELLQDWATAQNNLGQVLWKEAHLTRGPEAVALWAQAGNAYRAALGVYTKKELPQPWAATQNNLGRAFRDQASRTQGLQGSDLLSQAIGAFQAALEVYTKKGRPQDWALTQQDLGLALNYQARRLPLDSPERKDLLAKSIVSFRAALEIHTQTLFLSDWACALLNLANACADLPDERCVVESFARLLPVLPDCRACHLTASSIYHDKLFLFEQAHSLYTSWLARHPDDLDVQVNFIETHLTTGRFTEVSGLLAKVFAKLSPAEQVPLLAIEAAALLGQGKTTEAAQKRQALRALVVAQPAEFRVTWTFGGTRHFLQTDPRFAAHRAQLLALLSAQEQPNRAAILAALDACCSDAVQKP